MKYTIAMAPTWAKFFTGVGAAAVGAWLALVCCPPALAADGAQAAAAAKEATVKLQAYLHDLEKSKVRQPDYSKPPASEYLKHIFNTDALAALPAPKAEDFSWLSEWAANVNEAYAAMIMFGGKELNAETAARNLIDYQDNTLPAAAFALRLSARVASTVPIHLQGLVQMATGLAGIIKLRLKLKNVRLTAAALRNTATVWALLATPKERAELLARLEAARIANKDAGIDDDITAVETAIKSVRN
ncbi:MAG TPA: hypothetical protein VFP60_05485 [Pseudolabrys sp.]|nr:hypothetical protein [Pseudolabrys sp.]